ncbi:MAG: cytochrome c oxidase subunit 3 [Gammaproteobacteria bacterium]|nr:MAG: cytochrome c oxidase subunit 3 [Gammaproteobacteria bacterium]
MATTEEYYLPKPSHLPAVASLSIFLFTFGVVLWLNDLGPIVMGVGLLLLMYLFYSWFNTIVGESQAGYYNRQVDITFRQSMAWFITSEVFFFVAFFGSLFYLRTIAMPYLSGEGHLGSSHLLWEDFIATWPLLTLPDASNYSEANKAMGAMGIPLWNTIILLSSGVTLTIAHHALKEGNRTKLILGMVATITLGLVFFGFQIVEYGHAYGELGLKLTSGTYGSTFYLLTGFHGMHVTIGTIMLIVILIRCAKGHFTPENHFAFEGVAWYWHFVDVVWVGLFIFVYWL